MSITVMGGTTLPVVPMLVAFEAVVSGVISLSFTVNPA